MIRRFLLAAAAVTVASTVASAQTLCPAGGCTGTASFTVPSILRLIAAGADNANNTTFNSVAANAFDGAGVDSIQVASASNPTFNVVANQAWQVSVTGDASWGYTGAAASTSKAASDLLVLDNSATPTYVTVGGGATVQIMNGTGGHFTVTPNYHLIVKLTDEPGDYTMGLTYTIAAN